MTIVQVLQQKVVPVQPASTQTPGTWQRQNVSVVFGEHEGLQDSCMGLSGTEPSLQTKQFSSSACVFMSCCHTAIAPESSLLSFHDEGK